MGPFSLKEISKIANCSILGETKDLDIYNISPIETAKKGELTFLDNKKYLNTINTTKASAIIIPQRHSKKITTSAILLLSENPYASYARALSKFYPIKNNLKENEV